MVFEYALPIMLFLVLINWRGDGRNVAFIFLATSILFNWIIGTSEGIEAYVLYSFNELAMIFLIRISNGPLSLVKDMIKLSTLSIVVQLSGLLMWMDYNESTLYMALCQMVFILQIIRLIAHGLATGKTIHTRSSTLDSIHVGDSGKKL